MPAVSARLHARRPRRRQPRRRQPTNPQTSRWRGPRAPTPPSPPRPPEAAATGPTTPPAIGAGPTTTTSEPAPPAPSLPTARGGVLGLLARVLAVVTRVKQRAATFARHPRVRSAVRAPFWALPTPVQRLIRRRLRRWEPPQAQSLTRVHDPRLPVPPGAVVAPEQLADGPRVAIVLPVGADGETVEELVDHVALLQAAHRRFSPLFVTYQLDLRAFRRHRYLVEHFPAPDRYARLEVTEPWHEARSARLATILRRFAVDDVVLLPELGPDGLEPLRTQLSATLEGILRPG